MRWMVLAGVPCVCVHSATAATSPRLLPPPGLAADIACVVCDGSCVWGRRHSVMAGLEDDIAAAEAGDDDEWSSDDSGGTAYTPISMTSDESSQEEAEEAPKPKKRVWFKRGPKKEKKKKKPKGEFRGAWGSDLGKRPGGGSTSSDEEP